MRTRETATAQIDLILQQRRARVIRAAVDWVYNQSCSDALVELEDAVVDYFGVRIGDKKIPFRSG